jgi:RNA polymerase sigma factor (sigma-70 family)
MSDVTRILNAIERGDAQATDELLPLVYEELRLLAAQKLSHEPPGQTLQATALVHEAYLRLVGEEPPLATRCDGDPELGPAQAGQPQGWQSRGHFFAAAAEAMRRILVENARRKQSGKGGGRQQRVELDESEVIGSTGPDPDSLLALDEALQRLAQADSVKAQVVKLRYFAGLTIEQTAASLDISTATAKRLWTYARAWLIRDMGGRP